MSRRRTGAILFHQLRLLSRDPLPIMILVVFPLLLIGFLKPMFALALTTHGYPGANGAEQVVPAKPLSTVLHRWDDQLRVFCRTRLEHLGPPRASDATSLEIIIGKRCPSWRIGISVPHSSLPSAFPLSSTQPRTIDRTDSSRCGVRICLVTLGIMITSVCQTVNR